MMGARIWIDIFQNWKAYVRQVLTPSLAYGLYAHENGDTC